MQWYEPNPAAKLTEQLLFRFSPVALCGVPAEVRFRELEAHKVRLAGLSRAGFVLELSECEPSAWNAERGHRGGEEEDVKARGVLLLSH